MNWKNKGLPATPLLPFTIWTEAINMSRNIVVFGRKGQARSKWGAMAQRASGEKQAENPATAWVAGKHRIVLSEGFQVGIIHFAKSPEVT